MEGIEGAQVAPVAAQEVSSEQAPVVVPDFKGTKHKLVIDGQEQEVDYDELLKGYNLGTVSTKKMQEAAQLRNEVMELFKEAKQNPDKLFEILGLDPTEYSEKKLKAYIEEQSLTPEQRELRELKAQKAKFEAEMKQREELEGKTKREQEEKQAVDFIQKEILDALSEAGITEPDPRDIALIVEQLQASLAVSEKRITAKEAWERVHGYTRQDLNRFLTRMSPEDLHSQLPKEVIDKIRKFDIEKLKKGTIPKVQAGAATTSKREESRPKTRSMNKFFEDILPGNRVDL